MPVLVLLVGLVVGGARVWFARASVEQLAASSARAASVERTAGEAITGARRVASQQAAASGLRCTTLSVDVSADGFSVPVGTPASVGVRVRCAVPLSDVFVPGGPVCWHSRLFRSQRWIATEGGADEIPQSGRGVAGPGDVATRGSLGARAVGVPPSALLGWSIADDGRLLLAAITLMAWIAWVILAGTIVAETVSILTHRATPRAPARRPPGNGGGSRRRGHRRLRGTQQRLRSPRHRTTSSPVALLGQGPDRWPGTWSQSPHRARP
ncbi:MAG: hypothetical protein HZY73_17105 [Micropruina sp.]|nr:MAG: hypothetical protein HZY73_17105 [Micropruina sp.]